MTDKIEITQADRTAVAHHIRSMPLSSKVLADAVEAGHDDDHPLVEFAARHRTEARAQGIAAGRQQAFEEAAGALEIKARKTTSVVAATTYRTAAQAIRSRMEKKSI